MTNPGYPDLVQLPDSFPGNFTSREWTWAPLVYMLFRGLVHYSGGLYATENIWMFIIGNSVDFVTHFWSKKKINVPGNPLNKIKWPTMNRILQKFFFMVMRIASGHGLAWLVPLYLFMDQIKRWSHDALFFSPQLISYDYPKCANLASTLQ